MYIYIYIYCHPQTDCFVLTELFSVAIHAGRSKPGSKPIQLYRYTNSRPTSRSHWLREFLRYLCSNSSSVRLFTFLYLSATRVLNSFEELCITLAAADNSFASVLNPPCGSVYIVIHRQTVLFYQNSSVWLDTQDARNPSNFTLD